MKGKVINPTGLQEHIFVSEVVSPLKKEKNIINVSIRLKKPQELLRSIVLAGFSKGFESYPICLKETSLRTDPKIKAKFTYILY